MTRQNGILKLLALVLALNGVLCPCAAIATQLEPAPPAHHHANGNAEGDCHGVAKSKVCTAAMADATLPESTPPDSGQIQSGESIILASLTADLSLGTGFSVRGSPPQIAGPAARSTPVSRNDRLLD